MGQERLYARHTAGQDRVQWLNGREVTACALEDAGGTLADGGDEGVAYSWKAPSSTTSSSSISAMEASMDASMEATGGLDGVSSDLMAEG